MNQEQQLDTSSTVSPGENPRSESVPPRPVCRTVTLTDEPEENDAFSGPHQRIAGAVAQLIQPKDAKGISIGIEGSWGSGKSTVARLLTKQLETDKNITVVSFDAWAHEGDPLRRTFLETIIRKLQDRKWIDQKSWNDSIEELANRREVVRTKDKLTITPAGKLIAFILLLVPIGSAFITAALREDITLVPGTPAWRFLIYTLMGVALTFIPLVVLFGKIKHEPDIIAFLFNKGPTEKTTETSKTANPTSIEFEDSFHRLFKEALEAGDRRVVLILDNLDRVDSKDALTIWSTLQTFLQHKGTSRPRWHERLWLLVLYDINGLTKLWDKSNENEAAISFIDKSFQIRFEVPALVLSDWRHFLVTQLGRAFPDHTESDFHEVYRILAIWIAQRNKHLTIRELKLFVNQIGSVHRQWAGPDPSSDSFPLALIAHYALLRRENVAIVNLLFDPEFPAPAYHELLGSAARENLAALAFNVELDVAQQLLFSDKIKNALTLSDKDELARVASLLRRGFWEVFEEIARQWASTEFVKVADAALAIEESGILNTGFVPSVRSVTRYLCERAASVGAWSPLDARRAKGIGLLLKWKKGLIGSEEHYQEFIDNLSRALALGLTAVDLKLNAKEWLEYLNLTLEELESDTQQKVLTTIISAFANRFQLLESLAPFQVELMLEVLCELHERPEMGPSIEKQLRELADSGKIAAQFHLDAAQSPGSVAWITYVLVRYSSTFTGLPLPGEKKEREYRVDAISSDQMVEAFVEILERYKDHHLLFDVVKTASELKPLMVASLKTVVKRDYAAELFTSGDALDRLEFVTSHLGRENEEEARLLKLISGMPQRTNLATEIISRPFSPSSANLYLLVLQAGGHNQKEFVAWCVDQLRSLNSEDWDYALYFQHRLLAIAFHLRNIGVDLDLGEPYSQALTGYLDSAKTGVVGNDRENPASFIGPPGSTYRDVFQDNLEKRIRSDVKLPDWFFASFGLELKTQLLDSLRGAKVVALLTIILNSRHVGGLLWLRDTLSEAGQNLNSQYSGEEAWTEFKQSVKRALITQRFAIEKSPLIENIANILNISAPKNGLIAFGTPERDKICTLDPNNLETQVLLQGALPDYALVTEPTWSPDGKKLAYAGISEPSGKSEIFIFDYSSGTTTKVTDTLKRSRQPGWSPDGQMLAFVKVNGPDSDLITINLATNQRRRLTEEDDINEHPNWSPDGTMLVFHRIANNKTRIFVMNADGSNERGITTGQNDFDPSWSPDGIYIAFARWDQSVAKSGIYLITPEGNELGQLVRENDARAPAWSPDGTKLLFQVGIADEARIFQVDADGQNKKKLAKGVSPTWQPLFDDEAAVTGISHAETPAIADPSD